MEEIIDGETGVALRPQKEMTEYQVFSVIGGDLVGYTDSKIAAAKLAKDYYVETGDLATWAFKSYMELNDLVASGRFGKCLGVNHLSAEEKAAFEDIYHLEVKSIFFLNDNGYYKMATISYENHARIYTINGAQVYLVPESYYKPCKAVQEV